MRDPQRKVHQAHRHRTHRDRERLACDTPFLTAWESQTPPRGHESDWEKRSPTRGLLSTTATYLSQATQGARPRQKPHTT